MPSMRLLRVEAGGGLNFAPTPSTPEPTCSMRISNVHGGSVNFKLKTTAPQLFTVQPRLGTLKAGESLDVQVAMVQHGGAGHLRQQRILVQAAAAEGADERMGREVWGRIPNESIEEATVDAVIEATVDMHDELVQHALRLEQQVASLRAEKKDVRHAHKRPLPRAGYPVFALAVLVSLLASFSVEILA